MSSSATGWGKAAEDTVSSLTKQANQTASGSNGEPQKYKNQQTAAPEIKDSYHKGGRVKRTGPARLKKGERVLTKRQARKYAKKRG